MSGFSPNASAFCVPERKARRVEDQNGAAQLVDGRRPVERNHARDYRDGQIPPIADRSRRHRSDQHITRDAAETSSDKRENEDSEQIEPALDSGSRSADREYEGASEIQHEQQ
jgi:hypothetical protein